MGVIRKPRLITDADIPGAIARDVEYMVADAAHVSAGDPHPVYLTQSEGDGRYRESAKSIVAISGGTISGGNGSTGLQAEARDSASAAYMLFHRPGIHAFHLGMDTDNQLKVGGFSLGNISYTVWHQGNLAAPTTLTKVIPNLTSAEGQNGSVQIPHGLDVNKILSVTGRIEITGGQLVFSDSIMPNAQFYVWVASTVIVVRNVIDNSFLLLSKPLCLTIVYVS